MLPIEVSLGVCQGRLWDLYPSWFFLPRSRVKGQVWTPQSIDMQHEKNKCLWHPRSSLSIKWLLFGYTVGDFRLACYK